MTASTANPYPFAYGDLPAGVVFPITPDAANDIPGGPVRGLLVGTGGTATLVDLTGATRTNVPLVAGYNPIMISRLVSLGTAAGVWGLR